MVRLCDAVGRYRANDQARAYLYGICRRVSLEMCRHAKRQRPTDTLPEAPTISDTDARLDVQAMLGKLDEEERQIVVLHAVSGFKHREIASLLHVPLPTVLSQYNRAMKKLRTLLEEEEADYDE
jgi:RNA polymerase sigma-70 factor (ECF subfamily)